MSGALPALLPCCAPSRRCARSPAVEYQRGIVSRNADGRWQVAITGSQGSGILSSMSAANGMVVLHHEQGNVDAGDEVDVIPFDGLV
jgi:molybdopterin molybdotransferase